MTIARKNINGIIKTLEELQREGKHYISATATKNYNTYCYRFRSIDELIDEINEYGTMTMPHRGIWDSVENNLDFSDCINNLYGIYREARKRGYIK